MRLLTLAEALHEGGHDVVLATAGIDIPWLADAVLASGVQVIPARRDRLDGELVARRRPDWVVVDSYQIPAREISMAARLSPLLLFADGHARGADATMYLDQNLGAEDRPLTDAGPGEQLRGSAYALVRSAFTSRIPSSPAELRHRPPRAVVVLGGTDADDRTLEIAAACAGVDGVHFTFVAQTRQHRSLADIAPAGTWSILAPTPDLPALLAGADVVVSAAGTTAWDVCTLGVPTILLAVVDNQQDSLQAAVSSGVAHGADLVDAPLDRSWFAAAVRALVDERSTREALVAACRRHFDGQGARRVTAALADRVR
ncbi:hypothetical protein [Microbacterium sp. HJ5]